MEEITKRRLETARRRAIGQRNYRRARDRALRKLANQYPELYQEYLEEERLKDEAEGKSWLDISGRTRSSLGGTGTADRQSGVPIGHPNSNESEARHLAGEA